MEFGIGYFPTHDAMGPDAFAAMVDERGHESMFVAEHTHIPVSEGGPIGPDGGPLPRRYLHTYDPFLALTAAAGATRRLRIGTGICLVNQRDPIVTAKEVATLDHLSGGRFEFGVGAGWNRREMANHGTDPRTRMRRMQEHVEAMKAIWTHSEASYHGEFVDFDAIWSWPKPAQRPHPPVLVGGNGPTVLDRVLAFGDVWFPNYADDVLPRVRELADRADRPIDVQVIGVPADAGVIEAIEQAGVTRVVRWMPSAARAPIEAALAQWETVVAQLHGEA